MIRRCCVAILLTILRAQPQAANIAEGDCVDPKSSVPSSPLAVARGLNAPLAAGTDDAEFEHASFWEDYGPLLRDAWKEWEEQEQYSQTGFSPTATSTRGSDTDDDGFIDPALAMALDDAFRNPSLQAEATVKSLWTSNSTRDGRPSALPEGVYSIQLLTESGVARIRKLLDAATSSGIPTRRPNGMNRQGVIIDSDVHGAVSTEKLVSLVQEELVSRIARPIGRALFPDRVGCNDDLEYFAFTIRYTDGGDETKNEISKQDFELKEHRDASIITLNVNLNLPHEGYSGSEVFFRKFPSDEPDSNEHPLSHHNNIDGGIVRFSPGMAILHLGAHRHGALPISHPMSKNASGKRYNLVVWLFGKDGDVRIAPYKKEEQMSVVERWSGCNHTQASFFGQ